MKLIPIACITGATIFAAACQTSATGEPSAAKQALQAEIDAKQGEEVRRLCFVSTIDGWRDLGRDSVLLRRGLDWYKVDLQGTCQPQWAFDTIGLRSTGGSSCLTRGDRIETPDEVATGPCFITGIYEWDDDAEVEIDNENAS